MVGENKRVWTEQLDPLVDLGLSGLGLLTLLLFANQLLLSLQRFFPAVRVGWLTLIAGLALLLGMAGRKMRRGQHDLPRLIRFAELMLVGGITFAVTFYYPVTALVFCILVILMMEELGYRVAHYSEDLLFDFSSLRVKTRWEKHWETEGFRLYDRHIGGYRKLQQLILGLDLLFVGVWFIWPELAGWSLVGGGLFFCCQLLFLGVGYYQKKRIYWAIHGYEVDGLLFQRMIGLVLILTISLAAVAWVLPVRYNPVPWKAIGGLINSFFRGNGTELEFTLPDGSVPAQVEQVEVREKNMPMEMGPHWQVYIFIMFVGLLLLFFLAVFLGYLASLIGDERYRLQGLPALFYRLYRFLREMLSAWWNCMRSSVRQVQVNFTKHRDELRRQKLAELLEDSGAVSHNSWAHNPREEIVRCFAGVMALLATKDVRKEGHQTLAEYVAAVVRAVPGVKREMNAMRALVEEALYSLHELGSEEVQAMRRMAGVVSERVKEIWVDKSH